jgi:hypothetical protein
MSTSAIEFWPRRFESPSASREAKHLWRIADVDEDEDEDEAVAQ